MGTNFYAHMIDGQRLHIGKRSGAGGELCSFGLQGIRDDVDAPIDSWAKWKVVLRSAATVLVVDEYGIDNGIEAFIAEVESTTTENRRRQYDWMRDHGHLIDDPEGDWLCPDGFSFTYAEFT